jgi:soluble lytic murein transglycosylase-like protein
VTQYRNFLLVCAIAIVATATPAFSREAQIMDFDAPNHSLQRAVEASSPIDAQKMYEDDAEKDAGRAAAPPANLPDVIVPRWMTRNGASLVASTISVIASTALPNCQAPSYRPNSRLSVEAERRRIQLYPLVMAVACEAGVPGHLFDALVAQESRYNSEAVSPKGAGGLTQLMPETAVRLGVSNRFDVLQNLRGGARYLRAQLDEFGRYDLALGAYR